MVLRHKRRLLIALTLTALLVLGAVARHLTNPAMSSDLLPNLAPEEVVEIEIQPAGGESMRMRAAKGGWLMTHPASAELLSDRVRELTHIADAESQADYPESAVDPASVGLEPAEVRLKLNGESIEFGDRAPIEGHRYVRVGRRIHLIRDRHHHSATQLPVSLVGLGLIPRQTPPVRVTRRAEADQTADLPVTPWSDASAEAVRPLNPTARTSATITVEVEGQPEPLEFEWRTLEDPPLSVLVRPALGIQYHLDAERLRALLSPATGSP